eukprot:jgi/Mesvir1/16843/Mv15735-RA.2
MQELESPEDDGNSEGDQLRDKARRHSDVLPPPGYITPIDPRKGRPVQDTYLDGRGAFFGLPPVSYTDPPRRSMETHRAYPEDPISAGQRAKRDKQPPSTAPFAGRPASSRHSPLRRPSPARQVPADTARGPPSKTSPSRKSVPGRPQTVVRASSSGAHGSTAPVDHDQRLQQDAQEIRLMLRKKAEEWLQELDEPATAAAVPVGAAAAYPGAYPAAAAPVTVAARGDDRTLADSEASAARLAQLQRLESMDLDGFRSDLEGEAAGPAAPHGHSATHSHSTGHAISESHHHSSHSHHHHSGHTSYHDTPTCFPDPDRVGASGDRRLTPDTRRLSAERATQTDPKGLSAGSFPTSPPGGRDTSRRISRASQGSGSAQQPATLVTSPRTPRSRRGSSEQGRPGGGLLASGPDLAMSPSQGHGHGQGPGRDELESEMEESGQGRRLSSPAMLSYALIKLDVLEKELEVERRERLNLEASLKALAVPLQQFLDLCSTDPANRGGMANSPQNTLRRALRRQQRFGTPVPSPGFKFS